MAAGPNALRGSGPNPSHAFEDAMTQAGSPDPRNDRVCITSLCPRQFLNADEAGGQRREELQQLRSANAFADHHRAIDIYAVNLKNRLRDIETDRANLAHGRHPSSGSFRPNHPMAP